MVRKKSQTDNAESGPSEVKEATKEPARAAKVERAQLFIRRTKIELIVGELPQGVTIDLVRKAIQRQEVDAELI